VPSWEEVLTSFEATVLRSEALLSGSVPTEAEPDLATVGYDVSRLMMPPLPEGLRPRVAEVSARQRRVTEQLQAAMVETRRHTQLALDSTGARRAVYVDRRA
jgi:hypothetical protein